MLETVAQLLTLSRDLTGRSWIRVLTTLVNWLAVAWFAWRFLDTARPSDVDPMTLGPLDGLATLVGALDLPGSSAVSEASTWLSDPSRAPLVIVAALGSGVAASFAARRPSPPLALATIVLVLIAIDGGGFAATWWTVAVVIVPAAIATLLAMIRFRSRWDDRQAYLLRATTDHVMRTVFAYGYVLFAPALLIVALVELHRVDRPAQEPHDVARNAATRLMAGSQEDQRAGLQASIVAAAILSALDSEGRGRLSEALQGPHDGPTGAVPGSLPRPGTFPRR